MNGDPDVGVEDFAIDERRGQKRPIAPTTANGDDSDDDTAMAPPTNDIYRQRQQKRVHVL